MSDLVERVNRDTGQITHVDARHAAAKVAGYYDLSDEEIVLALNAGQTFATAGFLYRRPKPALEKVRTDGSLGGEITAGGPGECTSGTGAPSPHKAPASNRGGAS